VELRELSGTRIGQRRKQRQSEYGWHTPRKRILRARGPVDPQRIHKATPSRRHATSAHPERQSGNPRLRAPAADSGKWSLASGLAEKLDEFAKRGKIIQGGCNRQARYSMWIFDAPPAARIKAVAAAVGDDRPYVETAQHILLRLIIEGKINGEAIISPVIKFSDNLVANYERVMADKDHSVKMGVEY